jgi:hypothetical protein
LWPSPRKSLAPPSPGRNLGIISKQIDVFHMFFTILSEIYNFGTILMQFLHNLCAIRICGPILMQFWTKGKPGEGQGESQGKAGGWPREARARNMNHTHILSCVSMCCLCRSAMFEDFYAMACLCWGRRFVSTYVVHISNRCCAILKNVKRIMFRFVVQFTIFSQF